MQDGRCNRNIGRLIAGRQQRDAGVPRDRGRGGADLGARGRDFCRPRTGTLVRRGQFGPLAQAAGHPGVRVVARSGAMPPARTRAVIWDVGNDILFGHPPELIVQWVAECVARIKGVTGDITLATLPMENVRSISRRRYLLFRSFLFPRSRMRFEETIAAAERIERGLEALSAAQGLRRIRPRPDWYGYDPIHSCPGTGRGRGAKYWVQTTKSNGSVRRGPDVPDAAGTPVGFGERTIQAADGNAAESRRKALVVLNSVRRPGFRRKKNRFRADSA